MGSYTFLIQSKEKQMGVSQHWKLSQLFTLPWKKELSLCYYLPQLVVKEPWKRVVTCYATSLKSSVLTFSCILHLRVIHGRDNENPLQIRLTWKLLPIIFIHFFFFFGSMPMTKQGSLHHQIKSPCNPIHLLLLTVSNTMPMEDRTQQDHRRFFPFIISKTPLTSSSGSPWVKVMPLYSVVILIQFFGVKSPETCIDCIS